MAVAIKPLIATFEANTAVAKGQAVKLTASKSGKKVDPCAATTDLSIGVAQNAAVNVGDLVEVAMPGGGGKGLAKTTIAAGNILGHNADGSLQKLASASDKIIGQALDDAVAGDIFQIMVLSAQGVATQP